MRNQLCSLYGKVILTIYHLVLITISTVYTGENILNVHIIFGINKSVEGLYFGVNCHIIMTGVTSGAPEFKSGCFRGCVAQLFAFCVMFCE